jgi:hypothetical protein
MTFPAEARIGVDLRNGDMELGETVGIHAPLHVALENPGSHAVEVGESPRDALGVV